MEGSRWGKLTSMQQVWWAGGSSSFGSCLTFPWKNYQACHLGTRSRTWRPLPTLLSRLWGCVAVVRQLLSCKDYGFPGKAGACGSGAWPDGLGGQDGRAGGPWLLLIGHRGLLPQRPRVGYN